VGGELSLIGTLVAPVAMGVVRISEGYVLYLDRKFTIIKGEFRQTDRRRMNPDLDLEAEAALSPEAGIRQATRYKIKLLLRGTMEKPEVTLRGTADNPPYEELSRADIVSLLTIGRVRDNTAEARVLQGQSDLTTVLVDRAQALASQEITGYATRQLERLLRLDNVALEGNLFRYSQSSGPKLTVTKNVRDRLSLTYQGVIGHVNEQSVRISYKLLPILFLDGETDTQRNAGLDLRLRMSF
jgi:hypothetical protein